MNDWIELNPNLVRSAQPNLVEVRVESALIDDLRARGMRIGIADISRAGTDADVTDLLVAVLTIPDWCGSGWDSFEDAFDDIRTASHFPVGFVIRGLDRLLETNLALALRTVIRMADVSTAFSRAQSQFEVFYVVSAPTSIPVTRISPGR